MKKNICCVTGHRNLPWKEMERVRPVLRQEIERAVADGYDCFMSGFTEGVEQDFVEIVMEKQKDTPSLELIAVLPYRKRLESLKEKGRTYEMLEACSEVIVVQEEYHPSVYSRRCRYMAERCGRVVAVYDGREKGGTARMIRFAHMLKKELREIPVGEIILPRKR